MFENRHISQIFLWESDRDSLVEIKYCYKLFNRKRLVISI